MLKSAVASGKNMRMGKNILLFMAKSYPRYPNKQTNNLPRIFLEWHQENVYKT